MSSSFLRRAHDLYVCLSLRNFKLVFDSISILYKKQDIPVKCIFGSFESDLVEILSWYCQGKPITLAGEKELF